MPSRDQIQLEVISPENVHRLEPILRISSRSTPSPTARWLDDTNVVIGLHDKVNVELQHHVFDLASLSMTLTAPLSDPPAATGEVQVHHGPRGVSTAVEYRRGSGDLLAYEGPPWREVRRWSLPHASEAAKFGSGVLADGRVWGAAYGQSPTVVVVGSEPAVVLDLPRYWLDVAPDARHVACSVEVERVDASKSAAVVHLLRADGGAQSSVRFESVVFAPFFSRNGRHLIVVEAEGPTQVISVETGRATILPAAEGYWGESPDGGLMLTKAGAGGFEPSVLTSWRMADDVSRLAVLRFDHWAYAPWFSPDGRRLLVGELSFDGDTLAHYTVFGVESDVPSED